MLIQRILILRSTGQLGKEFVSAFAQKNFEYFESDESENMIIKYD